MYVTTNSGKRHARKTTAGWKLLVLRNNGTKKWILLSVMKNSKPVVVADFSVSQGVDRETAFICCVPYTLRCRDRIISGFNSRVKRFTHKYEVELPRTAQEDYALDENNGNNFWCDALNR